MNYKIILTIFCVVALAGCATTSQISLAKQAQHDLGDVEGKLFIPQNDLLITVAPTNPGPTGLLGVLVAAGIDAARRSAAEKTAAPILEQLHGYDFRMVMKQASSDAISTLHDVKFSAPLDVDTVASESEKRVVFDNSPAGAVLFVDVSYQLQSGNLYITARATMYPKSVNLLQYRKKPDESNPLAAGNAIYRKTFNFGKLNVAASDIQADLTEGANSIASQLVGDMNHPI